MPTQGLVNPIRKFVNPIRKFVIPNRKFVIPTRADNRNAGTHNLSAIPTSITVRSIPWKIQQF